MKLNRQPCRVLVRPTETKVEGEMHTHHNQRVEHRIAGERPARLGSTGPKNERPANVSHAPERSDGRHAGRKDCRSQGKMRCGNRRAQGQTEKGVRHPGQYIIIGYLSIHFNLLGLKKCFMPFATYFPVSRSLLLAKSMCLSRLSNPHHIRISKHVTHIIYVSR